MALTRNTRTADPYDLPAEPELADVLRMLARNIKLSIRTHVPAQVVVYDPTRQKATVQVGALPVAKWTDVTRPPKTMLVPKGVPPNAEAILAPIQLVDIPVAWPRTTAGYVTFPLVPGDTGELHVSDRAMESWLLSGIATDPVHALTHALKDSVFHPGLHANTNPITPATDLTATVLEGAVQVKLGRLAVESVAKAESFKAALIAAVTATVIVPMDGGASFKSTLLTALTAITPPQIGSVKVKVE